MKMIKRNKILIGTSFILLWLMVPFIGIWADSHFDVKHPSALGFTIVIETILISVFSLATGLFVFFDEEK